MLLDNFFKILSLEIVGAKANVRIELNPLHKIYRGHFPEIPVVPGVCMIQMLDEVMKKIVGREIKMLKGDHIKFLAVIDPMMKKELKFDINFSINENSKLNVLAELTNDDIKYFKFKGVYSLM